MGAGTHYGSRRRRPTAQGMYLVLGAPVDSHARGTNLTFWLLHTSNALASFRWCACSATYPVFCAASEMDDGCSVRDTVMLKGSVVGTCVVSVSHDVAWLAPRADDQVFLFGACSSHASLDRES